jgi:WD40 repeat protein
LIRAWIHPTWVVEATPLDSDEFISVGTDGAIRRFRFDEEQPSKEVQAPRTTVDLAAIRPDGRVVVLANRQGLGYVDTTTGDDIVSFRSDRPLTALTFSPDGNCFAAGDDGGVVLLWQSRTANEPLVLRGHSRGVYSLSFSPDGRLLASASGGRWVQLAGETKLWDAVTGQVHATLDGATAPLAFSLDGRRLAVSDDARRQIRIWTAAPYLETGREVSKP